MQYIVHYGVAQIGCQRLTASRRVASRGRYIPAVIIFLLKKCLTVSGRVANINVIACTDDATLIADGEIPKAASSTLVHYVPLVS